ncbi:MAG: hypothetical protein IK131_01520 [Paludibacteraceae bacterium]|nr:hypothetical protein [Paludibacteraceae bacterium]
MGQTYFSADAPDVNMVVELQLDGKTYELERFTTDFRQDVSNRDMQPKDEVMGGKIIITMVEVPDSSILQWASSKWVRKSGEIVFKNETSTPALKVKFEDAACVNMLQSCSVGIGSMVTLTISPRKISLNDSTLEQEWVD